MRYTNSARDWDTCINVSRDNCISAIYEGTTGIQALHLIGRKVMGSGGKLLRNFTKLVHKHCEARAGDDFLQEFIQPLPHLNNDWGELTLQVGEKAMENPDEIGAASVDYLMYGAS